MDYILISTSISHSITECHIHDHHDLNFSDHLPLSVLLKAESLSAPALKGNLKVNWRKSVDDGLIADYAHNMCQDVRPLLSHHFQSVSELNKEIRLVSKTLIEAASKHLSSTHHRKIKSFIRDTELSTLRKQSRKAWERRRSAGRPREGTLYEDKRDSKKKVRQHVAMCRAREERAKIQARDTLFSENSRNRFKSSNPRVECKGLRINENICTSPQEIAGRFRDYYKELATSSQSSMLTEVESTIPDLEVSSFLNCENILDSEIDLEEIECALKALKLGKSGGIDSLDPEHICFGGETLRLWLKKIFNRIIALEQIPTTLNEGLIIPVHKGKGKDPFKPESYRGITLSSVISKLFEIILLRRLSPILEEVGVPDFAQTAYQKGISCADAIFATQEALLTHVCDGGKPFLCLYDIEKAFDSVELPILLKQLFSIGINGKLWRLLKHWYSTSSAKVKVNGHISSSFDICRGVRQGSVLSPTLFLAVMDILLKRLRESGHGLHVRGTYMSGAIHADDLRTTAASSDSVTSQDKVIKSFTTESCLRLNTSKFEAVKISPHHHETAVVQIGDSSISTSDSAKCLGVWWNSCLSAQHSVSDNVNKARRAYFALGRLGAFQGYLNPLSSCSIFETCIVPILLYGSETWLLDSTSLNALESFQHEIGCRILHVPRCYSKSAVRIGLHWPSVATRVLIRKLSFLSKLLSGTMDTISRRIFTFLAMENVFETSIVQQCKMLEANLSTCILAKCLSDPENATGIVRSNRKHILRSDFQLLLSSSTDHHRSPAAAAQIANHSSWRRLWDTALDQGVKGTRIMQAIFRELCRSTSCFQCSLCEAVVSPNSSCLEHACIYHPAAMENLSFNHLISLLSDADPAIFSSCKRVSYSSCFWTLKYSN